MTRRLRFHLGIPTLLLFAGWAWLLAASASFASPRPAALRYAGWGYREDFSHGIPAWMSFPLAQDVGYDPSIYTTQIDGQPVLVRDVIAEGQRSLRIGLLHPLRFRVTPASVFRLDYELTMSGRITQAKFMLASAEGKTYSAAIPATSGGQQVELEGRQLNIPAQGTDAQLVVIEVDVVAPILGSHNRLIVRSFELRAERVAEVPILRPALARSRTMGVAVSQAPVRASTALAFQVGPGVSAAAATLYDGSGKEVQRAQLKDTGASAIELEKSAAPGLWQAQITAGGARTDFRFLVLDRVPPHPRLLLTPERLAQLRSQMPSNELLKIVHRKASELAGSIAYNPSAGENIALLSPISVFPGLPEYFNLMETYSKAIAFNALDYQLTGNAQSLESAKRALLTVAQWKTWTPAWFGAHGLHTYYEVGVFIQRVSLGYDLIADQLSAEEKSHVAAAFLENAITPALEEYFFSDRMPIFASNHTAQSIGGAIAACIAMYGDVPNWDARFGLALAELLVDYENLLEGLFPGDGSEAEPAGYENFAMEGMSWGMAALDRMGIRPKGRQRMLDSFWWPRYIELRPDLMLDTGDFGDALSALSGYAWGAEYAGNPALRAFYDSAQNLTLMRVFHLQHTGRALEEAPGLLDLVCCAQPAGAPPGVPPSRLFPLRGSAALRSGWDSNATLVSIRVGPWFNHEHHDQGSFQVAAFGEPLIAEAGYADYYKDPHYQDYFTQAAGHNVVLLDNDAFSQNSFQGRYWPAFSDHPRFTRHLLADGLDDLVADLAPAYAGALKSYTREYLFLKPNILIVRDEIQSAATHRYSFLLHVPVGDKVEATGANTRVQGEKASVAIQSSDPQSRWRIRSTPVPISDYGNLDKGRVRPRNALRLDSAPGTRARFLVGMEFLNSPAGKASLHEITQPSGQGFTASTLAGEVSAIFRTGPGLLALSGVRTDGRALAVLESTNGQEVFAGGARSIRNAAELAYSSSAPTDALVRWGATEDRAQLFSVGTVVIKVHLRTPPREVTVDGQPAAIRPANGFATLKLEQGEHDVRIAY